MSAPNVIWKTSEKLRALLWDAFQAASDPLVDNLDQIVLDPPSEFGASANSRLSIWLYRILENEFRKNQPAGATADGARLVPAPLTLSLFYLLTPLGAAEERRQQVLGAAMQALHDHAIMSLRDPVAQTVQEELHISLCRLTLEETARVFDALHAPYRLSVCYEVRTVHIASGRRLEVAPVRDRRVAREEAPA